MPITGREKMLVVLENSRSQSNKTVQHVFVREFSKQSSTAMHIWTWHKKIIEEDCLCRRNGSGQPKTSEETVVRVRKNSC